MAIILKRLFSPETDFPLRLFYIMAITACISNVIGFTANALIFGFSDGTIAVGVCLIAILISSAIGVFGHKHNIGMWLIIIIVNYIEFPMLLVVYGESTVVYTMLGLVGTALYLKGKASLIFTSITLVEDIAAILINRCLRDSNIPAVDMTSSLICSFVIAFLSITAMISVLISQYQHQNERLEALSRQLIKSAHTDPLTGIYNRRYLVEYLEKKSNSSYNETWCAILIDLDFFKSINDSYGHVFGDIVLTEFAAIMKRCVAEYGIVSRFGGEEFMIIFNTSDMAIIKHIMTQIKECYAEFSQEQKGIQLTFSGGAQLFDNSVAVTELFSAADKKLYQAKESGRNRIVY